MNNFLFVSLFLFCTGYAQASQNNLVKMYDQKKFKADEDKVKMCLAGLYAGQIQYRKSKGYFATLPNELKLNNNRICEGLQISTHFVTHNEFKMTAKFNNKTWSVDQSKTIQQIRK